MFVPTVKQDQKQGRKAIAHIVALKSRQRVAFAQTVVKKSRCIYKDSGCLNGKPMELACAGNPEEGQPGKQAQVDREI